MPSPAKDVVEISASTGKFQYIPNWAPEAATKGDLAVVSRVSALRHPATTSNPPDKLGQRAVAAWSKRWFRGVTLVQDLDLQPTSYWGWRYQYTGVSALARFPNIEHTGLFWQFIGNHFPFKPSLEFISDQVARTNVLNKIGQKKWDIGVFAGELKQTAGLVTDLATGMSETLLGLVNLKRSARNTVNNVLRETVKNGDFYKAAAKFGLSDTKLLDTIKDRWMQYQFGIRPALSEVDKGVTWLAERVNRSDTPMTIRAKAGHETMDVYELAEEINHHSAIRVSPIVRETCRTHYSVVYEMPLGHVRDITTLGLDNPAAVAWELMLLSWMFDYVVGVGSWLNSFTAANGLVFKQGTKSTLRRQESIGFRIREYEVLVDGSNVLAKGPRFDRGTFFENGSFTREVLDLGVTPAAVPQIKSTLDLLQLGNSLFALTNVFSGRSGLR